MDRHSVTNVTYQNLVVRTKLTPPRLHRRTLHRSRLSERLLQALDYRLTIVQAGAGYGKSTALAALHEFDHPVAWYHLSTEDTDSLLFLLHLIFSFRLALPDLSEASLAILEAWEGGSSDLPWRAVVDALINDLVELSAGPVVLILDDAHILDDTNGPARILDWLIGRAPRDLHVVLSARYPLKLPTLVSWRVRGEVLEIDQDELAFTIEEVASLFHQQYRVFLTPEEVERLTAETEGWAIALQLIWQSLRSGAVSTLPEALGRLSGPEQDLFAFLAHEVLQQQPPDVQGFLRATGVLREMTTSICDCLRGANDSAQILRYLLESGLFVVDLGDDHLRYHHLFRDFLRHQLTADEERAAHRKAGACCQRHGGREEAVYHLLSAEAYENVAEMLDQLGRELVRAGRLDTLAAWVGALPPEVVEGHPPLMVYLGDIARLHSRFNEALGWYRQAEERSRAHGDVRGTGKALRGQARVYLDTVNPTEADHLLQEALRLADGQEDRDTRARLLELLAENQLNLGRTEVANQFRAQARQLREEGPGEAELAMRVLLRTGQLDKARRLLREQAEAERREPVRRPRAHRETLLLLSLILSFQGKGEEAYQCAVEGTERGEVLQSPFVIAVGYMRQGHAWLLRGDTQGYEEACRCYRDAIALGDTLAVPRLKVEAFWGLCRAHGFHGTVEAARHASEQGIEIAEQAGDEWIAALIRVSMGAGYVLAQQDAEAARWISQAETAFRECGDTFGEAVARLWQCLSWHATGDIARLEHGIGTLLQLVREHRYNYLFQRQTMLGPPDPRRTIPLLLAARDAGREQAFAESLLAQMGLRRLEFHPGYQLRVQTLGPFRVWRGTQEIVSDEWTREKARQLLQFLLTYRGRLWDRQQIVDKMWPSLGPETGQRDFKVALSTLRGVLEPHRKPGAPSAYIVRDGSCYGLRSSADLWLDADRFERLAAEGTHSFDDDPKTALARCREALDLYRGDYLEESPYEDWCSEERERLLTLYLRTADRMARALVKRGAWEETIRVCQSILARDDCWEQAYRSMMTAYAHRGNRAQAMRTYERCRERLREALDVSPSPITISIYESIRE